MKTYHFPLWVLAAAALAAQDLTPRELFFAAPTIKAKAAAQAGTPTAPRPQQPKTPPPAEQAKAVITRPPAHTPEVKLPAIIPAAYVSSQPPLGLRYSLLLSRDNNAYQEVEGGSTFRSGDRLKITVEANDDAYLYVIARGSSGLWKVLFPVTEVASGDNFVQAFRRYEVPNGGRFYFDEQAGEEKLFLVLSRKPEKNFEDLIYTVTQPDPEPVKPAAGRPAAPRPAKTIQVAGLIRPIDDALVGKVRSELVARDLVFEKVDDSKPSPTQQKETAVYVVNKNAGPNGKVIVDLKLEHK
ncbi:MAG: DUF4384 domain-containing protein [Acidobacteria bacterium]|nr:DUF4384 domain-containing protein [Acidobacteriota bacterium]